MGQLLEPTVRSFCFCIDLKGACIFIAVLRIILSIIVIAYCIFVLLFDDDNDIRVKLAELLKKDNEELENPTITKITLYIVTLFEIINAIGSWLFIWGAITKKPEIMKPYLVILTINVVLFVLSIKMHYFITALIEIYILICSSSLYRIYLIPPEEQLSTVETAVISNDYYNQPPPQYSSCDAVIRNDYYNQPPPQYSSCDNIASQSIASNTRNLQENP